MDTEWNNLTLGPPDSKAYRTRYNQKENKWRYIRCGQCKRGLGKLFAIGEQAIDGIVEFYFDSLHMNEVGHKIMADIFYEFLMNNTSYCSKIK